MSETVLVTGGFGLVGSATVRRLAELGRSVVVADLDTPANRKSVDKLPDGVSIRWTDLTDAEQVQGLITDVAPESIIHLAAVIPPRIYQSQKLARRVNVDATATLVRIAEAQTVRPRFVHASSNAVFGLATRTPPDRRCAPTIRCGHAICTAEPRRRRRRSCGRHAWNGWCCDSEACSAPTSPPSR